MPVANVYRGGGRATVSCLDLDGPTGADESRVELPWLDFRPSGVGHHDRYKGAELNLDLYTVDMVSWPPPAK